MFDTMLFTTTIIIIIVITNIIKDKGRATLRPRVGHCQSNVIQAGHGWAMLLIRRGYAVMSSWLASCSGLFVPLSCRSGVLLCLSKRHSCSSPAFGFHPGACHLHFGVGVKLYVYPSKGS